MKLPRCESSFVLNSRGNLPARTLDFAAEHQPQQLNFKTKCPCFLRPAAPIYWTTNWLLHTLLPLIYYSNRGINSVLSGKYSKKSFVFGIVAIFIWHEHSFSLVCCMQSSHYFSSSSTTIASYQAGGGGQHLPFNFGLFIVIHPRSNWSINIICNLQRDHRK